MQEQPFGTPMAWSSIGFQRPRLRLRCVNISKHKLKNPRFNLRTGGGCDDVAPLAQLPRLGLPSLPIALDDWVSVGNVDDLRSYIDVALFINMCRTIAIYHRCEWFKVRSVIQIADI